MRKLITMKKYIGIGLGFIMMIQMIMSSCSDKGGDGLPESFNRMGAPSQMEYLMERDAPDSVARFICYAALGKIEGLHMDMGSALAYAYEHYDESGLVEFQMALEEFQSGLPLADRVRLTRELGMVDLEQFGYELGLNYVGTIRVEQKQAPTIREELAALRKECASYPDFYSRFMKGFKTALKLDRHRDLDDRIYTEFITYQDTL